MYLVLFNPLLDLSLPLFYRNGLLPCCDLHLPYFSTAELQSMKSSYRSDELCPEVACEAGQQHSNAFPQENIFAWADAGDLNQFLQLATWLWATIAERQMPSGNFS